MSNKVIIGRFGKAFGLHGCLKIHSFTNPKENILNYSPWFISKDETNWIEINNHQVNQQGMSLLAKLPNTNTPEQAVSYVNYLIAINKSQLKPISETDEYYWNDLIGCTVYNTNNILLGIVDDIFATVSNDVLVIKNNQEQQHLVPFLKQFIIDVNLSNLKIIVDWDENFFRSK